MSYDCVWCSMSVLFLCRSAQIIPQHIQQVNVLVRRKFCWAPGIFAKLNFCSVEFCERTRLYKTGQVFCGKFCMDKDSVSQNSR